MPSRAPVAARLPALAGRSGSASPRRGDASGPPAAGRRPHGYAVRTRDAAQASIVQWPELCGRGAISLPRRRPSGSTNISSATIPIRSIPSATAATWARAASAPALRHPGRGEGEVEDVVGVAVLAGSKTAVVPSVPRAAMAEISAAKGTKASSTSGRGSAGRRRGRSWVPTIATRALCRHRLNSTLPSAGNFPTVSPFLFTSRQSAPPGFRDWTAG